MSASEKVESLNKHVIIYAVLSIAMFCAFSNCMSHDFVYWDDPKYVVINEAIRGFTFKHIQMAFSRLLNLDPI